MRFSLPFSAVLAALTFALSGRAYAQAAAATPLAVPASPANPVVPMDRQTVWVHVRADRPVTLVTVRAGETTEEPVCDAPCDYPVPLDGLYGVTGPGMQPSGLLRLKAAPEDTVSLDVSPASKSSRETGEWLAGAGAAAFITGGVIDLVFVVSGAVGLTSGQFAEGPPSNSGAFPPALLYASWGLEAAAIPLAIAGVALMMRSTGLKQSRTLTTDQSKVAGQKVAGPSNPWTRLPVWRETREVDPTRAGLPRVASVPLFSTSF